SISSMPTPRPQAPRAAAVDSDGDNDGSKAAATKPSAAPPAATVYVSKPTATLGNSLDVQA
ncbi:hypothetical protein ACVBEH_25050, partial [Roseateles sp. GG27B]